MKTFIILALLIPASLSYAHIHVNQILSELKENSSLPSHHIRLITKEGYRLEGLLIASNDSQLIIFPGKYKEWKLKKNYMMVHYPCDKIGSIQLSKIRNPLRRIFKKSKKNLTHINGCKERFLSLKELIMSKNVES